MIYSKNISLKTLILFPRKKGAGCRVPWASRWRKLRLGEEGEVLAWLGKVLGMETTFLVCESGLEMPTEHVKSPWWKAGVESCCSGAHSRQAHSVLWFGRAIWALWATGGLCPTFVRSSLASFGLVRPSRALSYAESSLAAAQVRPGWLLWNP